MAKNANLPCRTSYIMTRVNSHFSQCKSKVCPFSVVYWKYVHWKYEWLPNFREQPRIGFRKAERIMKAAELVKKYGIAEGERRMISDTKGIIWRENREGTLIPVLIYIPGKDED